MTRRTLLVWLGGMLAAAVGRRAYADTQPQAAPPAPSTRYPPPMSPEMRAEWDASRARALAALPYRRVTVSGERALAEWERLRREGQGWPVIVGDDEQLDTIAEQFSLEDGAVYPTAPGVAQPSWRTKPPEPAAILARAEALSTGSVAPRLANDDDLPEPPLGAWPAPQQVQGAGLTIASDILSGKSFPQVHILLIPAANGWEVPAYLRWGGWNACPSPEEHVAMLRYWHARFGAELVGINRDTLNLRAARPPQSRAAALELAREQYRYCPDVIDQGAENLSLLAAILMADAWWFLWWD